MAKKVRILSREALCSQIWRRLELLDAVMTSRAAEQLAGEELRHIATVLGALLDTVDEYFMRIAAARQPNGRPGSPKRAAKKKVAPKKGNKRR